MTFRDWIISISKEHSEEKEAKILKADVKMLVRRKDGTVVICHSEYQDKRYKGIDLRQENSSTICG